MKVIFLDIDGVLNSYAYDRVRGTDGGVIDKSRLPILKEIVDKTGAKIVLSSTWKEHWSKELWECDYFGREIAETFIYAEIEIYDKTPTGGGRANEIKDWLSMHKDVESFVIIDDLYFGWGDLADNLVRTDPRIGRGLEEKHKDMAIAILNRN